MESYSLKESLNFISSYNLNENESLLLRTVIGNHAIEGMYASSQDIHEMIQILRGHSDANQIISSHLKAFKVGKTTANYLIALNQLLGPKVLDTFTQSLLLSVHFPTKSLIELQQKQKTITLKTELSLRLGSSKGDLSYSHLKRIHRTLFEDIYSWAGCDRYDMDFMGQFGKDDLYFCLGSFIPKEANILFNLLQNSNYYKGLSKQEYIEYLSVFYADLHYLQPFREGNGQSIRIFIDELAQAAGYNLNLALIAPKIIHHALKQSHKGYMDDLKQLITTYLKDIPSCS